MATSKHISLVINHRGIIERSSNGLLSYVDGETSIFDWVNVDMLSGILMIKDILTKIGYPSVCDIHWLQPGMGLDGGLQTLKFDKDVVKEGGDAPGSTIAPNVTPSRGRTKVCARRTPTPKKAHGPKRALLLGEGCDHEDNGCETNVFSQPPQTPTQPAEGHEVNQKQPVSAESVVPKTNQAQRKSAEVPSLQVESSQTQNPEQQASVSTPNTDSVDMSSVDFVTQYVPIPHIEPLSQPSTESHHTNEPFNVASNALNSQNDNTQGDVQGTKKKRKNRSTKRTPSTGQTFVQNPDPSKPPSVYVPVNPEDFSDEDAG
ncbi:hypothetical protein PIB30_022421 [Stylosanthes scabra]|uniref:PB1-like domain-containing protein n=1 Tax=Stylosanthes scabra TaxID=79078 RepID=A0ABU6Q923_9FABA|nr:hypothetical protein [Stylosanthes scabra]